MTVMRALARHLTAFDGEQFAADLGPGQAGDDADQILRLDLAVAILRHAEILVERSSAVTAIDFFFDVISSFTALRIRLRQLALEIAHAGLARVAADERQQRLVVDRPLLRLEAVLGDLGRDQVLARDLDLLVLGVAGDADDLHAVHQRRRDVERVRRGDEHHVREVVVDLEVVVVERRVLLRVEHLEQRRGRIAAEVRRPSCRSRRAGRAGWSSSPSSSTG